MNFERMHAHIEEILALPAALNRQDVIDRVNWANRYPCVEALGPRFYGAEVFPTILAHVARPDLAAIVATWNAQPADHLARVYEPLTYYDTTGIALDLYTDRSQFEANWGYKTLPGAAEGRPLAGLWVDQFTLLLAPKPDVVYQLRIHALLRPSVLTANDQIADENMARYVCAVTAEEWAMTLGLDVAVQRAAALAARRLDEIRSGLSVAMPGRAVLQGM